MYLCIIETIIFDLAKPLKLGMCILSLATICALLDLNKTEYYMKRMTWSLMINLKNMTSKHLYA